MNELEEALHRARAELAQLRSAIDAARGQKLTALAEQLASLQAETADLDTRAAAVEADVAALREEEDRALKKLNA